MFQTLTPNRAVINICRTHFNGAVIFPPPPNTCPKIPDGELDGSPYPLPLSVTIDRKDIIPNNGKENWTAENFMYDVMKIRIKRKDERRSGNDS